MYVGDGYLCPANTYNSFLCSTKFSMKIILLLMLKCEIVDVVFYSFSFYDYRAREKGGCDSLFVNICLCSS